MADNSAIEWTDATWNPIRARNKATGKVGWHCEHTTTGCEFCYAEGFNKRLGTGLPFKSGHRKDIEIFLDEDMLTQPLRWKKPRKIFVCSMTDLFAEFVPDKWIDRMLAVMMMSPQHTFQVLTKRADRMHRYLTNADHVAAVRSGIRSPGFTVVQRVQALCADFVKHGKFHVNGFGPVYPEDWARAKPQLRPMPLPNVWLGVSTECQQEYGERKEYLRNTPAAVRFFSMEPLLGPIEADYLGNWVIVGGESGTKARPMHGDWVRSLRDQCATAGVPFFLKQWGEWAPQIGAVDGWTIDDNPEISRFDHREWEDGQWSDVFRPMWCDFQDGNYDETQTVSRIGKKRAGRLLDGKLHNEFPTTENLHGV